MPQQIVNVVQPGCTADFPELARLYAGQTLFVLLQATKVITKIANSTSEMKYFFKFIFISVNSEIKLAKKNESQQIYPFFSTVVTGSLLT
jgi:hypothetical protein